MVRARIGDTVRVHYTGRTADGHKFDSSHDHEEPLEIVLGQRQLIIGFEEAVVGMEPGESKVIEVPVDRAYGPHNPEKIVETAHSEMPEGLELLLGTRLQGNTPGGQEILFTIVGLSESKVTLDGNHPLAGKELTFELQLVEIMREKKST